MKYHFRLIVIFSLHSFVHGQTLVAPNDQCEVTLKQSLQNAFIEAGGLQIWMPFVNVSATGCRKRPWQKNDWCIHDTNGRTVSLPGSALESYVRNCDCEYGISLETTHNPMRGTIIGSLPHFGPEWKIRIQFTVRSLPTHGWTNILHFSYAENQLVGSRYPSLFLHQNGDLHFTSHVNGNPNFARNYNDRIQAGETYDVLIQQLPKSNGHFEYKAIVNDVEVVSEENTEAIALEKAFVYWSDPWYDSPDLDVSLLKIEYKITNPIGRIFEKTSPFSPRKGHQETTLRKFGPAFKIVMELKLKGFPSDLWGNIFHVTHSGDMNGKGSRYPALFLNKNRYFGLRTCIDDNANYVTNYGHTLVGNQLYDVTIQQKLTAGKWMYQIFVDGIMIVSKENTKPMRLDEAKLYLSDPWYNAANVEFTYLRIEY